MQDGKLSFAAWIENEPHRIADRLHEVPPDALKDYVLVHMQAALRTVHALCREGLADDDAMRPPSGRAGRRGARRTGRTSASGR